MHWPFSSTAIIDGTCAVALTLSPLMDTFPHILVLSTSTCTFWYVPVTSLVTSASMLSCVVHLLCLTSLVLPPGSTSTSVEPTYSTCGLPGGLSGLHGQCSSSPSSPGPSSTSLNAFDTLILTLSWLLHPLMPSGLLGGSMGASGWHSLSPVASAGSSDGLGGSILLVSHLGAHITCSVWPCWSLSGGLDLVVMGCSCIHGCTHCRCGSSLIHGCIHSVCLWWCWWFNESWAARWGHGAYTIGPMVFHGHFAQSCGCSYLFINFPVWCFIQLLAHSLGNFLTLPSSLGVFDYPCEFLDHLWLLLHKTSSRTSRQNNFCLKEGTHEQTLYPWTMERDPKSQTREDLSDKCQSQLLWTQEDAWLCRSRMEYKVHVADYLYQSTHKRRRLWNKQKCEK